MAADNERGYSKGHQVNMERGGSGQGHMPPPAGKHKHMAEPTNHAGHTHEMARTHEHNARVESIRSAHAGAGQRDHEQILHQTHKLHQGHEAAASHGNKHGADHHMREESPAHERRESAAEREHEGE